MPEEPTTESRRFLIYNCGTERIGAKIRIGGESGKNVVIVNETNGCRCKLNTLPGDGAYLEIDSDKGKVEIVSEATDERTLSFESHDEGYITLESCGAIIKEYVFSYEEGSNIVQCPGQSIPGDEAIDKYILLCGEWHRIVDLTDGGFIIDGVMTNTGDEASTIATMNVIRIDTEATLNRLEVDYTPMVR